MRARHICAKHIWPVLTITVLTPGPLILGRQPDGQFGKRPGYERT